jgi:hypothetical protein
MVWFHAEISTDGWDRYFLLDMTPVALIQDLLIPLHNRDALFLDGKRVPLESPPRRCKIVATDESFQTRFKSWFDRKIVKPTNPKAEYLNETRFFDAERDVSNSVLHEFARSTQLETVRGLLGKERQLKQALAEQPKPPAAAQIKAEIDDNWQKMAKIIGAFVGAAIEGWTSGQT